MRDRIASVNGTKKITEAMKLVAAAKVRRAQDAVINARPFSESLVKVLFAINTRLAGEDVDVPLCNVRPVKTVLLLVCTGDRGLCGGFNNFIIRKTEARVAELERERVEVASNGVAVRVAGRAEFASRAQIDRGVVSILTAFERHRETTATSRDATRFDVVPSRSRTGAHAATGRKERLDRAVRELVAPRSEIATRVRASIKAPRARREKTSRHGSFAGRFPENEKKPFEAPRTKCARRGVRHTRPRPRVAAATRGVPARASTAPLSPLASSGRIERMSGWS